MLRPFFPASTSSARANAASTSSRADSLTVRALLPLRASRGAGPKRILLAFLAQTTREALLAESNDRRNQTSSMSQFSDLRHPPSAIPKHLSDLRHPPSAIPKHLSDLRHPPSALRTSRRAPTPPYAPISRSTPKPATR